MELDSTKRALLLCAGAVFVMWMVVINRPISPVAAGYTVASYETVHPTTKSLQAKAAQTSTDSDFTLASAKAEAATQLPVGADDDVAAALARQNAAKPVVLASAADEPLPLPAKPDLQAAPSTSTDPVNANINVDQCVNDDACVDNYLWALYQRAPKIDSMVVSEQRKVEIKNKKGKKVTVTRTFSHAAEEDFTSKDPQAANKINMPLMTYVIGGMDRAFKQRLFRGLHAAADAGFFPGITSAFRDDYRQSLATGLHAADNRSFHGGSLRGGYGHGLAADIVSVDGPTRADRLAASQRLWEWMDKHGPEFGLGRPYLGHDPPHVAPNDGEEYAKYRGPLKPQAIAQAQAAAQAAAQAQTQAAAQTQAQAEKPAN